MTSDNAHLTEDERHTAAGGAFDESARARLENHLSTCRDCSADVARIAAFMNHTRETPPPATDVDELWPSIRTRIDAKKVVPLPSDIETASAVSRRRVWQRSIAVLGVAAALVIAALALRNRRAVIDRPTVAVAADTGATFASLVDSVDVYEQEAKTLLDRLELQRAMLRPDAAQTLDHDLHVVDLAIGELKDAVARDPRNPALRQLLATSYRQKIDLLKRVGNAS